MNAFLFARYRTQSAKTADLLSERKVLAESLSSSKISVEKLASEKESAARALGEISEKLRESASSNTVLSASREAADCRASELANALRERLNEAELTREQLAELESALIVERDKTRKTDEKLETLLGEIKSLSTDAEKARRREGNLKQTVTRLEASLKSVRSQLEEKERTLDDCLSREKQLSVDLEKANGSVEAMKTMLRAAQKKQDALDKELGLLQSSEGIRDEIRKLNDARKSLEAARRNLDELRRETSDSQRKLEKLLSEVKENLELTEKLQSNVGQTISLELPAAKRLKEFEDEQRSLENLKRKYNGVVGRVYSEQDKVSYWKIYEAFGKTAADNWWKLDAAGRRSYLDRLNYERNRNRFGQRGW